MKSFNFLFRKKYSTYTLLIISLLLFVSSCKKEEIESNIDADGLTQEIRNIIPDSILNKMKSMGMPINGGNHPPLLTKGQLQGLTYLAKPFILRNSNVPNDNITYIDYRVTFKNQNNSALSIIVDYVVRGTNGVTETGTGLGSFIVGDGCKFSVFTQVQSTASNNTRAKGIIVISGTLVPNGVENFYESYFMVDDYGDPQNALIAIGQGRVLYDSDGFSELVGTPVTWYTAIPDCPCKYSEAQKLITTLCPSGTWSDCGNSSQDYHYGSKYEVRWFPSVSGRSGQQCNYDASGNLITGGIAVGSPDKVSPGVCGFWGWLATGGAATNSFLGHKSNDIDPWKQVPCWQYLRDWPANNSLACNTNVVSSISNVVNRVDNLSKMIGSMTCEEATLLIKSARETTPPIIDATLRNYIIGTSTSITQQECKTRLQAWKGSILCTNEPALCSVLAKSINNL